MADFEWLSLDEFYDKVQENIEKSGVDVKGHDRVSSGHVVHVRSYKQQRTDAATPMIGVTGPVKHFNKPNDSNKMGGQPKPVVPTKEHDATPVVPVKHPGCEHCKKQKGENEPEPDSVDKFSYSPAKNPIEGKTHDQISLNDIAQVLHKYPFVHSPSARKIKPGAQFWKDLSPEQREKHLKNDPFKHLTEDGRVALMRDLGKVTKKKFGIIGEWLQLHRLEGYDPETLHNDFVPRLIEEMGPFLRSRGQHGYAKYGTKEHAAAVAKHGKDVPMLFHQGMDTDDINTGDDLMKQARVRTDKWARRFFEKEAGFDKLLNNEDIKAQTKMKGKLYKTQHEIDKLQRKAGIDLGHPKIDTSMNYDLSELEKIGDKTGFRIEKETSPDGNLQRILIFEDDPDSVMSGFGDDDKAATPKEVVDLQHGGKLSDVRDKMAGLVNPSATGGDVPLKKYRDLESQHKDKAFKLHSLHHQRSQLQEKIDRESVPPEQHYKTMTEYASKTISGIEGLQEKGTKNKNVDEISIAVTSALEYLEDNDFTQGMSEIKGAKSALQAAKKDGVKGPAVDQITAMLEKMQADAEAYRSKRTMSPEKRKAMIGELENKLNELDGDIIDQDKSVNATSTDIEHLKGDPSVQKYMELQGKLKDFETKLDQINPKAEAHWKVALEKQNSEGDSIGNYSDDLAVQKYKQAMHEDDQDHTDWDETVPEHIDPNDENNLTEAGSKMVQAIDHNPSGHFIFGSLDDKGHQAGLVHVAKFLTDHFIKDEKVGKVIGKLLDEHPAGGKKVPAIYKVSGAGALSNEQYHRWEKIHDLYNYKPTASEEAKLEKMSPEKKKEWLDSKQLERENTIDKYAIKFSDYYPWPTGTNDIYEHSGKTDNKGKPEKSFNKKEKFADLANAIMGTSRTKDESKREMPVDKVFKWQYYDLLRFLGNHAVEEITKNNPEQKAIFEKIKELNKPHGTKESTQQHSPGNLRRDLARRMDVIYGHYAGGVPSNKKESPDSKAAYFPEWDHDVKDPQDWLSSIGHTDEDNEKSLVIFANDLQKGRVSHVIFTDE